MMVRMGVVQSTSSVVLRGMEMRGVCMVDRLVDCWEDSEVGGWWERVICRDGRFRSTALALCCACCCCESRSRSTRCLNGTSHRGTVWFVCLGHLNQITTSPRLGSDSVSRSVKNSTHTQDTMSTTPVKSTTTSEDIVGQKVCSPLLVRVGGRLTGVCLLV